jgi:hypothetical protein
VKAYLQAFTFPFRKDHLGVVVFGLFVLWLVPLVLGISPLGGGIVAGLIDLGLLGYYALFLQSILHATMEGKDRIPAWPEMNSPMELFQDFFTIIAPFIVSFLPLILLHASVAGFDALASSGFILRSALPAFLQEGSVGRPFVGIALLILGWLYLPMAVLAWSFFGGTSILNPVSVAKAAWSTGASYLLVVFLVWAMVTSAWAVSLIPGQYLTAFGSSLLVFYALIVAVRLVGLHYRINRQRLGWERGVLDAGSVQPR